MPLQLEGSVALRVAGEDEERLRIDARDLVCEEGGLRILDQGDCRHEFLFTYNEDPRFSLEVTALVTDAGIVLDSRVTKQASGLDVIEEQNTLSATFHHDPNLDDEPLTPVSSN